MRARRWRRILLLYALLLVASHTIDRTRVHAPTDPALRFVIVNAVQGDRPQPGHVRIAYRDSAPGSAVEPVVLIHGSPGSGEVLHKLGDLLSPRFRVIVPDLPGFGASTHEIPDYSFRAHAKYLIEFLDAVRIPRAQLAGFSMGGGVCLSLVQEAPDRVLSIAMLSAIGVQEHEMTGSYTLNHWLHAVQLAALWTLRGGVPHFGFFHRLPLTIEYARNFYDSDQRPLRAALEQYRGPMLIIHGVQDANVPIAAAREHHQIVRQSELLELDGNHFLAFTNPEVFVQPLSAFLEQQMRSRE